MAAGSRVVAVGTRRTDRQGHVARPGPAFASVRLEGTRIGVAANAEGMYRMTRVSGDLDGGRVHGGVCAA